MRFQKHSHILANSYYLLKCPRSWWLFHFEARKWDSYRKAALKRGRHLFQSKSSYSFELSELFHCLFSNNNKELLLWYISCLPEQIIFIISLFMYLCPMHFDLVAVRLWSTEGGACYREAHLLKWVWNGARLVKGRGLFDAGTCCLPN